MDYLGKLNVYLANLAVLNATLHNLHWNVEGMHFFKLHDKTEELYDEAFGDFDEVAELLKAKNLMPASTLSEYLKLATLKEVPAKKFETKEVVDILYRDLNIQRDLADAIRNEADEASDYVVVMMFEDFVAKLDKTLWFIRAMLG